MYSRAELSRTGAIVVALLLTANAASTAAWEFRTADSQSEDLSAGNRRIFRDAAPLSSRCMRESWKDLEDRSHRQGKAAAVTIMPDFDRKPFEAAMAGAYAKAQRDRAAAEPIERIRKME